jgi:hypothetical protein
MGLPGICDFLSLFESDFLGFCCFGLMGLNLVICCGKCLLMIIWICDFFLLVGFSLYVYFRLVVGINNVIRLL